MFLKEKAASVLTIQEVEKRTQALVADTEKFEAICRFFQAKDGKRRLTDGSFAQDIIARQLGFDDRQDLLNLLDHETLSYEQARVLMVFAAFAGHDKNVASIKATLPSTAEDSTLVWLLQADARCLQGVDADNANELIAPLLLTRICYLLNSQIQKQDSTHQQRRIELAKELINLGADVNVGMHETDSIRGFKTLLGSAIDCVGNAQLVQLLLDSGAAIDDGPTLYEGCAMWYAVQRQNLDCLKTLIAAKPPLWHLCHALTHAIDYHNIEMVRCLLDAGADPDWNQTIRGYKGSALHEALVACAPLEILELLLDRQANVEVADRIGRTPIGVATALGNERAESLLVHHGAKEDSIRSVDRWIGQRVRSSVSDQNVPIEDSSDFQLEDHLWIHEAIKRDDFELAAKLVEDGLNPFAVDYAGNTALHLVVAKGRQELCDTIVDLGQNLIVPNFDGETPLSLCYAYATEFNARIEERLRAAYDGRSMADGVCLFSLTRAENFELAADAISNGELEKLDELLRGSPDLVSARSIRPHRCALITYVGVNGFEGERQTTPPNIVQIINLLLSKGCDPSSVCFTYRGGPGENAIGLLTSSGVPPVELQLPMVHALVQGGAWVEQGTRYLVDLYNAFLNEELADFLSQSDIPLPARTDALLLAIYMQHIPLVRALLDSQIDVNATTEGNVTAIHQAAFAGNRELVDLLLSKGADPRIRDSRFDGTAAGWADANGHEALSKYLEGVQEDFDKP